LQLQFFVLAMVNIAFPLVSAIVLSRYKQKHMRKDSWVFENADFSSEPLRRVVFWGKFSDA